MNGGGATLCNYRISLDQCTFLDKRVIANALAEPDYSPYVGPARLSPLPAPGQHAPIGNLTPTGQRNASPPDRQILAASAAASKNPPLRQSIKSLKRIQFAGTKPAVYCPTGVSRKP